MNTQTSFITHLKNAQIFMRITAFIIIFAHTAVIGAPTIDAIRGELSKETAPETSPEAALSESFVKAIEQLALLKQLRKEDKNTDAVLAALKTLQSRIIELDETVLENFATLKADLLSKNLPDVILKRHDDMVSHYQSQNKNFMALLAKETKTGLLADMVRGVNNLLDGDAISPDKAIGNAVSDGTTTFSTNDFKRSQQEFDPNNLGTKALQPDKNNTPKASKQAFIQSGLRSSPSIKVAALGDFTFSDLEGANDPLYLAETDEVQLTQSIKNKAAELDYDTVKIYHWVRNNIEWLPSWGAIQDAELTLEAKRGNAMDISSLTISLLRASKIPARYVHGTIDVPVDKFMNWAGGFSAWEAAANYASSAGIPITSVTGGGQAQKIRMEHIWVEAATDFHPSRGAKNKNADTWLQLDPSFKQYEYQEGLDVVEISGLDMGKLAQDFVDSGTVNEAEGWATGFDPSILQTAQQTAQTKLEAHIKTLDNPTVGDVIGGKKTIIKQYPTLPSAIPNTIKTIGTRYDKLPSLLQQKIEFAFAKDILGDMIDPISFAFAKLNNEKVTLSFKPATQADEDALASLIPEGITDVSELPTSIPSYLVSVIPELKVNGETVKTGYAMRLGEEIPLITGISLAGKGKRTPRSSSVIAGSYLHINIFAGSISYVNMNELKTRLSKTSTTLESKNVSKISVLTRDDILGEIFYAGGIGYYAQLLSLSDIVGIKSDTLYNLAAGYGTIGYEPNVNSFFGIPRGISTGGIAFDIPIIFSTSSKDGDNSKTKQFNIHMGTIASALEHVIPEKLFESFNHDSPKLDAFSAVKALQKATDMGQHIYTITHSNMNQILPLLEHDRDTLREIRAALNSGKVVTTHSRRISITGGWSGFGYILLDPNIGDGAYKISGGKNGSYMQLATEYRMLYGASAWSRIRSDRLAGEKLSFNEAMRNAEHFLYAYESVCDLGESRARQVTLVYAYWGMKAIMQNINLISNGPMTIPYVGTFDFRTSRASFDQLVAGLSGAAHGSDCSL